MKFDPQTHHRRSIRLKGYDYSKAGAYYITIVAWHRECLFGDALRMVLAKVVEGEMKLNQFGEIVREEWERSTEIHRELELGAYVVMPNHFHAIVILHNDVWVGATGRSPLPSMGRNQNPSAH